MPPPPGAPPAAPAGPSPSGSRGHPPHLPPPPPERGPSRGLVLGLVVGGTALVVVLALIVASVVFLGRRASDEHAATSESSLTSVPTSTAGEVGRCGTIPPITAQPGAADPDLLVRPTYVDGIDVSRFEQFYGDLTVTDTDYMATVDEYIANIDTPDLAERRAELVADGFRGGFQRTWSSDQGDTVSVRVAAFADPAAAQSYAELHLRQACATDIWDLGPTPVLPGAAAFMQLASNGRPQVRTIAVVGNDEVNVTVCACRPADTGLTASQLWVQHLQRDLVSPTA